MFKEIYSDRSEEFYKDIHEILSLFAEMTENFDKISEHDMTYYRESKEYLMRSYGETGRSYLDAQTKAKLSAVNRLIFSLSKLHIKNEGDSTGFTAKALVESLCEAHGIDKLDARPDNGDAQLSELRKKIYKMRVDPLANIQGELS